MVVQVILSIRKVWSMSITSALESLEDVEVRNIINELPKLDQRQYSLTAQAIQLIDIGHKLGLYDGADLVKKALAT